jgi:hypothetical protein
MPVVPELVRHDPVAGLRAGLRFLRSDGGYHAAALTYYLILALFPAGALIYALLGIFGAESAVDDAAEELAQRGFDRQYDRTPPRASAGSCATRLRSCCCSRGRCCSSSGAAGSRPA